MTQLNLQNFTTLVENSAAAAQGSSVQPLNLDEGSVLRAIIEADAAQALWLQYLVVLVLGVTRLSTSYGGDCDTFGADFGYTRLPAVAASGFVTFSRYTNTQSAFIPVGTKVLTADQTQTFLVVTDTTNPNYVASPTPGYNLLSGTTAITLPIVASIMGTGGNVLPATISLIQQGLAGVDLVTNTYATAGGVNAESDAAFKSRFVTFINSRSQGTATAVAYAIEQVQQGLTWSIQENQTALGYYQPGTFVVTIDDGTGSPPGGLITTCNLAVQAIRPIGSTAIVQAPSKISANIACVLTLVSGAVLSTIEAEVSTALTSYINSLSVGAELPYSKLGAVIYGADSNIINVTGITLNGGSADLVVTESQVIRAGTVVVS